MIFARSLVVLVLGFGLALAACRSRNDYAEPPGLSPITAATVIGSRVEVPQALVSDQRTYIAAVDSHLTRFSAASYLTPLLVAPGAHSLQIAYEQGGVTAEIAVHATVAAGHSYIARSEEQDGVIRTWIEEELTGAHVTEPVPVVGANRPGGPFLIVPIRK